jgi:hypothetical protein
LRSYGSHSQANALIDLSYRANHFREGRFCMSRSLVSIIFLIRVFAFAVVVAFVVALHRVCIRTLMSRM